MEVIIMDRDDLSKLLDIFREVHTLPNESVDVAYLKHLRRCNASVGF